jgi:hypothetical protein
MEMYEKAYQQYTEKCGMYGIDPIDIIDFIQSVTKEQVEKMNTIYNN